MAPCRSTAEEVSFEWSHHRISSTDSKVRTTLHVSITDSGSEDVILLMCLTLLNHQLRVIYLNWLLFR